LISGSILQIAVTAVCKAAARVDGFNNPAEH
jgi:hypothetical protein